MALKYKDHTQFMCQDDKCKVDVGEPGLPVAAVDRGKKVGFFTSGNLVAVLCVNRFLVSLWFDIVIQFSVAEGDSFLVADHDCTRSSLTPSVTFHINIPDNINQGWYDGKVHVGLKCSVFQPSSPFRHALEL